MAHPARTSALATGISLLAAVAIAGCGEKPEPGIVTQTTTTTTSTAQAGVFVTYERDGGKAGVHERLSVTNDGGATLEIGVPPNATTTRFDLTSAELHMLQTQLAGADLKSTPSKGCAHCFEYTIQTRTGTVHFDETAVPAHTQGLLDLLGKLVADNISAHAAGGGGTNGGK